MELDSLNHRRFCACDRGPGREPYEAWAVAQRLVRAEHLRPLLKCPICGYLKWWFPRTTGELMFRREMGTLPASFQNLKEGSLNGEEGR